MSAIYLIWVWIRAMCSLHVSEGKSRSLPIAERKNEKRFIIIGLFLLFTSLLTWTTKHRWSYSRWTLGLLDTRQLLFAVDWKICRRVLGDGLMVKCFKELLSHNIYNIYKSLNCQLSCCPVRFRSSVLSDSKHQPCHLLHRLCSLYWQYCIILAEGSVKRWSACPHYFRFVEAWEPESRLKVWSFIQRLSWNIWNQMSH